MYRNSKLNKAVRLALAFGAASSMAFASSVVANEEEDGTEAKVVERIQVTGSRIKRTDLEQSVPITVIDREAIDLSGQTSVTDLLRSTTFNSTGSFRPQSGSSAQGTASLNLRGLGASRTLILIDGRRLTMSPSTGSSQDLNSIPLGAVERIEILTDGASAIYGSDAIGGVVNVITRKDYTGVQVSLTEGQISIPADGGDRSAGSVLFGAANDSTNMLGGVSWNKREIVFARDYPWIEPGSSIYGNNWITSDFASGYYAIPGGCEEENYIKTTIVERPRCQYNFNATNANEASTGNESIFVKVEHQINDDWKVFSNASIAKTSSFGRYAPAPDSNFFQGFAIRGDSFNNPTNPEAWLYDTVNNPNAVPYAQTALPDGTLIAENTPVHIFHRFAAVGNRDTNIDNENVDFLFGTNGVIGNVEVEAGIRRVRNKTYEIGNGYLAAQTAWNFVNDFNPGYCSNGSFNDQACRSGYDIQNPGSNPSEVLRGSAITTSRISNFDIDEVFGSVAFDMFELPAGLVQAFVGAEYRKETYSDNYDAQSEAGQVGGSAGNSAGGSRSMQAAFFEILAPVTDEFELSLAGRYDDYSDYGDDFSPKISGRYEPLDGLVFRASYGKGFRAPTLDILTQLTSFAADSITDEATCAVLGSCPVQINAFRIANPDLDSEQSTQMAAGVAYQPTDWLSFTVDYYNIEVDNRIAFFSSQGLINRELAGDPTPAGLGVTRRPDGSIDTILTGFGNEGDLKTSGFDVNVQTTFDFAEFGSLRNNLQVSHISDYSIDGGRDNVKDPGVPQQRVTLSNIYSISDFDIAYNISMIGNQYESIVAGAGVGNVGTWTTHDLQVTYNTPWEGRVTVGAENLFEKRPQLIPAGGREFNYDLYHGWGRITYVRYTQNF